MVELRPFQQEMIEQARVKLRTLRRVILQGATGSGKTVLCAHMTGKASEKGKRIWFIVHRRELVNQSSRTFNFVGIDHGIIAAGYPSNWRKAVQIAGIQTLIRRLERLVPPDIIVWDECITGDSLITTDVGVIRIDDVLVRRPSYVLSWDGSRHVWKRITAWRNSGRKKAWEILLCSGKKIRGTANHPVLTVEGWRTIGEITLGDRILCSQKENANIFSERSSGIRQSPNQTKEASLHASRPTIQQNKQSGPYTKQKNSGGLSHVLNSLITLVMEIASYACGLRAFRALMRYSALYEEHLLNMSRGSGWTLSGLPVSLGGIAMMGATNIEVELLDSTPKASVNLERGYVPGGLRHTSGTLTFIGTNAAIGRLDYQPPQQSNLLQASGRTSQSVCDTSWEIVSAISECSDELVYDISVADTECFFANGILVHNCHHTRAKSWADVFSRYPDIVHIGLTATPMRLDGKGLGNQFQDMVCGPSTRWLIDNGYLSQYRLFSVPGVSTEGLHRRGGDYDRREVVAALERGTVMGDTVTHYLKHASGRRGLVFEASIERSEKAAQGFRNAGVPAIHIDGGTDPGIRDRAMRDLQNGSLRIVCNVDLFGEGVDVPAIEYVGLCRPTDSLCIYLQQVGRGLRKHPGKDDVLIFDHAGNVGRHGRPDDERTWNLTGDTEQAYTDKVQNGIPVRQCKKCYAVNPPRAEKCLECGTLFPIAGREIEDVAGELQEDAEVIARREQRREQGQADTLEQLIGIARARGYRHPEHWAQHVMAGREKKRVRA